MHFKYTKCTNTLSLKFLSLDYDTRFNLLFVNYWHAILWVERHILLSLIIHHDMGNASHLLKCENTNKLKSVKGEKIALL